MKNSTHGAPVHPAGGQSGDLNRSFADLGLRPELLDALRSRGYERPTPIQARSVPHLLEGRDLLGVAQTGTGKTAAFALPHARTPERLMTPASSEARARPARWCSPRRASSLRPDRRELPCDEYGHKRLPPERRR